MAAGAAFCPSCGTRQYPDQPMPVQAGVGDAARLRRSTDAWLLVGMVALAVVILLVGVAIGGVVTSGGDEDVSDVAETMDAYAPLAEAWVDKYEHVADEAGGDDPNGLATAAEDARLWIDDNRGDLGAAASGAGGGSAPLFQELVTLFDERATVLADLEATATAGGAGTGSGADEMAALAELEAAADEVTCEIAEVMRTEGADPGDHITPEMEIERCAP